MTNQPPTKHLPKNDKYRNLDEVVGELKNDYLFGIINDEDLKKFPSLKDLADIYNVSHATLKERSAKERWSQQRKDVKAKIDKKVIEDRSDYEAEKIVQIDSEYETAFSILRRKTVKAINSDKHTRSSDFLNFANTLITCYEGEKVAHGESLDENKEKSGWDALSEAFKEPEESSDKKEQYS